jgi:hypothetical protein
MAAVFMPSRFPHLEIQASWQAFLQALSSWRCLAALTKWAVLSALAIGLEALESGDDPTEVALDSLMVVGEALSSFGLNTGEQGGAVCGLDAVDV